MTELAPGFSREAVSLSSPLDGANTRRGRNDFPQDGSQYNGPKLRSGPPGSTVRLVL